jgi:hypothetical protein
MKKMTSTCTRPQNSALPLASFCKNTMSNQETTLLNCEYFPCKSFRNRCNITGPNGPISLSVPLLGGRNQKIKMKDLQIANQEKWQLLHWRTLDACYRRTPFFEYFEADIHRIYTQKHQFLLDLNLQTLDTVNKLLRQKKTYPLTENYIEQTNRAYIDKRNEKATEVADLSYLQPFSTRFGFTPGLSILDMLFCCGNQTGPLLLGTEK